MSVPVQLNDIGTQFIATLYDQDGNIVNISTATTLQIIFKKPDGTKVTQSGTLLNTGSDGKFYYTSQSGDINLIGRWQLQGYIVIGVNSWYTDPITFQVGRNL